MDQGLDTKQVNYVLAEMEDYAQMCDENSGAEVNGNAHPSCQIFSQSNRILHCRRLAVLTISGILTPWSQKRIAPHCVRL